jgi:DNA-binding transcriptional ArsR family regulator
MAQVKNERQLERIVRGFSNHRRIQIMRLLDHTPELSVEEIAARVNVNFKTASEHVRRLTIAGLVVKRNEGRHVRHKVTPRGRSVLSFLKSVD